MFDGDDPTAHREVARWAIADLVEAGVGTGVDDELERITAEAERLASISGATRVMLVVRRARAILEDGPSPEAFETALEVEGAALWPFELARTRLSYGAWMRRHRRIVAAREPLRAAADAFELIGATPWEERARTELRASGEASVVRCESDRGRIDAAAAAGRSARGPRALEPRHRSAAVPVAADDLVPPVQHLPEARRDDACAACGGHGR